jgi:hypothetical protein
VSLSIAVEEADAGAMGGFEVAELQPFHDGDIGGMVIAPARCALIVEEAQNGGVFEWHVVIGVDMELTPLPLPIVFGLKMPLQPGECLRPGCSHNFLLSCITLVREVDIVVYSLLHVLEGDEAHLLRVEGLHQLVELEHEDLVERGAVAAGGEVAVEGGEERPRLLHH